MDSTKRRMIGVAVVVCGFAVGMAGMLNYFKYRSTATNLVKDRLLVTGRSIDGSIQSSLALGLQFADIGTLPGTMQRERATDDLILSIDIFDPADGKVLYSTDSLRMNRQVPPQWVEAARKAGTNDDGWFSEHGDESAAGMSIDNNFGLIMGHLALRYSNEKVQASINAVGQKLALGALLTFLVSAGVSSLALVRVMKRLDADVLAAEQALRLGGVTGNVGSKARGPFGAALRQFVTTVRQTDSQITELRARLNRGAQS